MSTAPSVETREGDTSMFGRQGRGGGVSTKLSQVEISSFHYYLYLFSGC